MRATITTRAPQSAPRARLGLSAAGGGSKERSATRSRAADKSRGLLRGARDRVAEARAPRLHHDHSYGDELRSRVGAVLLGVALLSGPVAAGLLITDAVGAREVPVAAPVKAAPDAVTAQGQTAGAYAADFLVSWLAATRDNPGTLKSFMDAPPNGLPAKPASITNVQVVSVRQDQGGLWSVVVAGTVTPAGGAPARRYYQIPVLSDPHRPDAVRIAAVPAPVAGVAQASAGQVLAYSRTVSNEDVQASVQGFLTALLVRGEDISRFVSPGVTIAAVSPALYRQVRLESVQSVEVVPDRVPSDGTRMQVWAQASGVDAAGSTTAVAYPLTLTARDGRWDVASLDPAPAASRGQQTATGSRPVASPGASASGSASEGEQ